MSKIEFGTPIATVHRDDLEELGFDTSVVDDATMARLASKMGDAYVESSFWIDLEIIAEFLEIPKKQRRPRGAAGRGD